MTVEGPTDHGQTSPAQDIRAARSDVWQAYAGIVMVLAGIFNFVDGIVTINDPRYFVRVGFGERLVFGDTRSWGWALFIVGLVQIVTGVAIFLRQLWAAVVAITVAMLSSIGQLLYIGTNPWWSVLVITLDIFVVYALSPCLRRSSA
jgi:hypothetical protein